MAPLTLNGTVNVKIAETLGQLALDVVVPRCSRCDAVRVIECPPHELDDPDVTAILRCALCGEQLGLVA